MPASMPTARHQPVLLKEALRALSPGENGIYIDGTFGAGGYSRALLNSVRGRVLAIDRDPQAVAAGTGLAQEFPSRFIIVRDRFSNMRAVAERHGHSAVDGVVLDIGLSSMQLDSAERGFSFQKDGPLDMRMEAEGQTAADVVNTLPEKTLAKIIAVFGEERRARAIARVIVAARAKKPFTRTGELERLVVSVLGKKAEEALHPATRTFQALRIYVNRELEELVRGLGAAEEILKPGGRLAAVTFHSLEDRILKRFLVQRSGRAPKPSRHLPETTGLPHASFTLLEPFPLAATAEEIARNPRARSAKLRAAIRTSDPAQPLSAELIALSTVEGHA